MIYFVMEVFAPFRIIVILASWIDYYFVVSPFFWPIFAYSPSLHVGLKPFK